MVAAAVTFQGTRVDAAQAEGGIWTDLGGGKAATETDFTYQGAAAVSEKVGTSEGGVALDMTGEPTATVDFTTPQIWIAKHIATTSGILNVQGATGGILEIGSGGIRSNYDRYYVVGSDNYPIKGGWLITPIDPNGGNQSARPGLAPTLTAIDYYGWACDFSATAKAENVAMDAVDYMAYGEGLLLLDGSGGDADGTFQDFIDEDEGTVANRWGVVSTLEGILYVTGFLNIGSATETDFSDSGQVIVFPDAEFLNLVGFFGIGINLGNASSVISIINSVFKGRGSTAGTVDTRPDYPVINTSGVLTLTGNTYDTFRLITFTSGVTVTNCIFIDGDTVIQASAILESCSFLGGTHGDGDAYLDSDDPSLIDNCNFVFSDGHAIEYTGAATDSFTIVGLTFTGYGADGTTDAAFYNPNTSGTLTLNATGVTGLTVRTAGGGTTIVNNAVTIRVEGVTPGTAVTMIANETVGTITIGDVLISGLAGIGGFVENTGFNYEGAFDPSGLDVIARARNQGIPEAGIADDNGVFTDQTDAANSNAINTMNLLPVTPVATEDSYLFGHTEQFDSLKLDISTAGTGGFTIVWEYWDGDTWETLSATDGTSSLSVLGENLVSWTIPGDWATTTINSQGPFYYVRARYTAGAVTVTPLGRKTTLNVTKYLPFNQNRIILPAGLTVVASWIPDTISTF